MYRNTDDIQNGLRQSSEGRFAVRFFTVAVAVFVSAGGLAFVLIHTAVAPQLEQVAMPRAFWITTVLLFVGSAALHRALYNVRLERQRRFRRNLLVALAAGTLFVGGQVYGLWCMLHNLDPARAQTGTNTFVFVFAALHAMHFTVAMLFLVYVTVKGFAHRYDHEYFWGVTVAACFWHALGIVWVCILAVFAIAWSLWIAVA